MEAVIDAEYLKAVQASQQSDAQELPKGKFMKPAGRLDSKPTNPKDAIAVTKAPMHLVPSTIKALASMAFAEGASKYGAYNWRVAGVRASVYKSALERHLEKWWNGEDVDPVTGVPHIASIIACAGIIADAGLVGKLTDDRPPAADIGSLFEASEVVVEQLYQMNADKNPRHYTIEDTPR